jgi:hypothetical protein
VFFVFVNLGFVVSFKKVWWFSKNYYLRCICCGNVWLEGLRLRGKPWSIDDERLLRQLVEEGRGIDGISQVMGKTRTAIKGKLNNLGLGLNLKVVATGLQNSVATTSLVPIVDSVEVVDPASVANS